MLAHLEMDQAAAFLANYLVADLRLSILTALSKNSVTKRCKFLFFDFLHWKSYLLFILSTDHSVSTTHIHCKCVREIT